MPNAQRLERASRDLPSLECVSEVVDSETLASEFEGITAEAGEGEAIERDLKYAMAAVCIPLLLTSSAQPGAAREYSKLECVFLGRPL